MSIFFLYKSEVKVLNSEWLQIFINAKNIWKAQTEKQNVAWKSQHGTGYEDFFLIKEAFKWRIDTIEYYKRMVQYTSVWLF